MLRNNEDDSSLEAAEQSKVFLSVRFALLGFDPIQEQEVRSKLVSGGGVDVGENSPKCSHLIVGKVAYDDPRCVVARKNGRTVVTSLWVDHSIDIGSLANPSMIFYRPVKDLNGIPGAKALSICLTGYQRQDREDIMHMVGQMGAHFSKPLVANKVTHLICYKFEGEKYELAKKLKMIKLVNHRWLEDCLRDWELVPECNYVKSGYELETMEAEAKDSEEEKEDDTSSKQLGKLVAGEPSNLPRGSGTTTSKGSKSPTPVGDFHRNSVVCKALSEKTEDVVKEKMLSTIPPKDGQSNKAAESHYASREVPVAVQGLGAYSTDAIGNAVPSHHEITPNVSRETTELASNLRAAEKTPCSEAAKSTQSYMRRTPGTSSNSKSLGMLSTHLHASPHGYLEKCEVKDGTDISTCKLKLLPNSNLVSGGIHGARKDSELHVEEGRGSVTQKRKSIFIPNSISAPKFSTSPKGCPTGSSGAGLEASMTGTPLVKSNSPANADYSFGRIDLWNSFGKQSVDLPKTESFSFNKSLEQGLSGTVASSNKEFSSNVRILDTTILKTPETSPAGLKQSNLSNELRVGDGMMSRLTDLSNGELDEPQKELHDGNLAVQIGTKKDASPKPVRKKTVSKKTLGSRSKPSVGSTNKQKGSLSLDRAVLTGGAPFDLGDSKVEKTHGKTSGVKPGMTTLSTLMRTDVDEKASDVLSSKNKVEEIAACDDDETEAPEEDSGAELDEAFGQKMAVPITMADIALEKKSKVANSANETKRNDIDSEAGTLQEAGTKLAKAVNGRKIEVGNSGMKAGTSKGKEQNSSKTQKDAASLMKNIEKSEINGVEFGKKTEEEKMKVEKEKVVQHSGRKFKTTSISLEDAVESGKKNKKLEVGKVKAVQRPTKKLKTTTSSVNKTPKPMNGEKGDNMSENRGAAKGRRGLSSKDNKIPEPVLKETEPAGGLEPEKKTNVEKMGEVQCPASKLNNKTVTANIPKEPMDAAEEMAMENGGPIKGRKRLASKSKKDPKSVEETDTTGEKKGRTELEINTSDDKMAPTEQKVQCCTTRDNSKTRSTNKAKMPTDAEKENKPMENGALGATLGKRLRAIASSKSNKKPVGNNMDSEAEQNKMQSRAGSNLVQPTPMCFILSGHRLQRKEFQQVIKCLGGRFCKDSHHWSYQATHFIVPEPVRRTEKFFAAAASGRWILKTDYLTASSQAGKFLAEEPYEWYNDAIEDGQIDLVAPRKWRLLREKTGHGSFNGMRIVVYGAIISPPLDTLKRVVKAGDGIVLATSPPYTRFLNSGVDFAVVGPGMPEADSWIQEFLSCEIPCIAADYLVEYVCKPGHPLDKHILFETHATAKKSFEKLVRWSEEIVEVSTPSEGNSEGDLSCQVCGLRDRAEVMLVCGDESGSIGCGIGTHIDCCDPPLEAVPEGDWFCPKCSESRSSSKPSKSAKKKKSSSAKC